MKYSAAIFTLLTASAVASPLLARHDCISGVQTMAGRQCTVECGIDYFGGDYDSQNMDSSASCFSACANDKRCSLAQYHVASGICYFKNAVGEKRVSSDTYSIMCEGTTTEDSCNTGPFPNGRVCKTYTCMDRPGGDYKIVNSVGGLSGCVSACNADSLCMTAQYHHDNDNCYLKSSSNPGSSVSGTDTVDCMPGTS